MENAGIQQTSHEGTSISTAHVQDNDIACWLQMYQATEEVPMNLWSNDGICAGGHKIKGRATSRAWSISKRSINCPRYQQPCPEMSDVKR
jgi:hypothetical protein